MRPDTSVTSHYHLAAELDQLAAAMERLRTELIATARFLADERLATLFSDRCALSRPR